MKSLSIFILSLFLFFSSFALPASAANPSVSLRLAPNRRYVFLTFSNLRPVSRVSYTLTYTSSSTTKGFEGGFKTTGHSVRAVRRQILGTCSSGRCVFHSSPHAFELTATFYFRTGGSTTVTKTLP